MVNSQSKRFLQSVDSENRMQMRFHRTGVVLPLVITGLALAILVGGGAFFYLKNSNLNVGIQPIMTEVTRGEFVSLVLDQGEIQSSENVEIRCEAKARNGVLTVLRAVAEGNIVKEGDFLVQLDATGFEKELEQQKVILANAETLKIQADTKLKTSKEALREYELGTFVELKKMIENEIFDAQSLIATSKQNLRQAEANFEHSKKLAAKGYTTPQELQSAEFAVTNADLQVQKAANMLELGDKKMWVLENITSEKFKLQFQADIDAAVVGLRSAIEAYEVEKAKIEEIESMQKKCLITVPKGISGQVVYAKESSRGGQDWVLEEGGTVRENQVLIRLPNPKKMEVKALINEQSITQIKIGMPVKIRVDALNNVELTGQVTKVNQYAEQSGWMSSSIRKYAVFVRILNPPDTLKPGMNSSVSIQTKYEDDALLAPIQSIYGIQGRQFCLVKKGENSWETREVQSLGENSQYVMIAEGLDEGEQLVMNPGAYKDMMDLPEVKLVNRIDLGEEAGLAVDPGQRDGLPKTEKTDAPAAPSRQGVGSRGAGDFKLPANALVLINERDKDADGKLSREEVGEPFVNFFDRIDTDGDNLLADTELDASIQMMRQRQASRQAGAGPGSPTSAGGPAQ